MAGGLLRLWFERRKARSDEARKDAIDSGILYTSGMIAGEGLVGVLLAVFAVIKVGVDSLGEPVYLDAVLDLSEKLSLGSIGSLVFFVLLILSVLKFSIWRKASRIG